MTEPEQPPWLNAPPVDPYPFEATYDPASSGERWLRPTALLQPMRSPVRTCGSRSG